MKNSEDAMKQATFEELLVQNGYIVYTSVDRSMMPLLQRRRDIIKSEKKGSFCSRRLRCLDLWDEKKEVCSGDWRDVSVVIAGRDARQ